MDVSRLAPIAAPGLPLCLAFVLLAIVPHPSCPHLIAGEGCEAVPMITAARTVEHWPYAVTYIPVWFAGLVQGSNEGREGSRGEGKEGRGGEIEG